MPDLVRSNAIRDSRQDSSLDEYWRRIIKYLDIHCSIWIGQDKQTSNRLINNRARDKIAR